MLERVMPWLGSFRDQVVLITGASSGIGRETAVSFARQGAALALAARRREQLEETAHAVTAAGGRALVIPTDVTNQESTHAAVAAVKREWKRIDILVNNAGILKPSRVEALTAADFEAMLKVNVFGALFMMQAVLPVMRKQKQGTIINVASLAGRRGVSPLGGYCATKFALVGLTEALRTELDDRTIHIGLVMPGVIDTPMVENAKVSEMAEVWPSMLNMPVEWVATAIMLAVRFRLIECSVPPGAATLEKLGALAPGITDVLLRWSTAAGRMFVRNTQAAAPRKRRVPKSQTKRPA